MKINGAQQHPLEEMICKGTYTNGADFDPKTLETGSMAKQWAMVTVKD